MNIALAKFLLILLLLLPPLFFLRKVTAPAYPILGADPLEVTILEDHRDALQHWVSEGVRNAVLVNIDAHDDLKKVSTEHIAVLKALCQGKESKQACKNTDDAGPPVTNADFIHAAAKLEVLSSVYWVIPNTYGIFSNDGSTLTALLRSYGFPDEDIVTFSRKGACFAGTTDGIPITICDAANLPQLDEPVLLSFDTDYFPQLIGNKNLRIINAVRETFKTLAGKELQIRDATVAFSVNGGFLSTGYRWIGELVIDILRNPSIIAQKELPPRYTFLQRIDLLFIMERYREVLDEVSPLIAREGADPTLFIYAARASGGLGLTKDSFRYAEKACMSEKSYCYGLPEIGITLLDQGKLGVAERFFTRGYDLCTGMDHGQFRLAMALKDSGRYEDAIKYFKFFRDCYGSFPVDFYIADTFLLMKDEASALKFFESGRKAAIKNPESLVRFGDRRIIEKAAAFYATKEYRDYASELRKILDSHPN
ncbi:M48 family metallopeptidase [Geobacter sp. DSM 9736]|uniref:tetratricopeptide repeat protein n=1 Tax=Geobacter sp. DSM 9736 TaxID=1277350 RepID=UPI000B50772F|nr:hypothetical protein [Geobacter sp. DSM 9736]SNB47612.1 hypothetical protein SAMN06269301_3103 [Geobacter sp. DSM 9736]